MLHFAEKDKFAPPEAVEKIKARIQGPQRRRDLRLPRTWTMLSRAPVATTIDKPSALMAHLARSPLFRTRDGAALRSLRRCGIPHCMHEFGTRDVDATMRTMVAQPYVNHIPTMTGGVGHDQLKRFYKYHFIPTTPKDTKLIPISRTIGAGIVVDEMLFCFTHDIEIDWMLPGIAPTGKYVEIPLVAIVSFRGDKLYNEHIYWDQASVLVQVGLLKAGRVADRVEWRRQGNWSTRRCRRTSS